MKAKKKIVLASASPRRKEMFDVLGVEVEVMPSEIAEVGYGGDPRLVPERISLQKAKAVLARQGPSFEGIVLAADTIVALDGEVLGKPRGDDEGKRMLERLSGKTHQVYTGVVLLDDCEETSSFTVSTDVKFRDLSSEEMDWYVGCGEGRDKAGGYGIQGRAGVFIEEIQGSYSNVVGLPLSETIESLRAFGGVA